MTAPARVAAYEMLLAIARGQADLPSAIAARREGLHDDRDRALAADIATGAQRWQAALDFLIDTYAKRSHTRLDLEILIVLRLSVYQLLHLTRVPASAVVDDGVNLARRAGKRSASGFVNAVLRAISRHRHSLPLPPRPDDPRDRDAALAYLSTTGSHPRWLVARWYDRLGFDVADHWVQFNNQPAPLTLRANRLKASTPEVVARLEAAEVRVRPGRFAPDALIVEEGRPLRGPLAREGWFVPQDEASQLVPLLAGTGPILRILDTCAAPGGKATQLAVTAGTGHVVACDVRRRRVGLLQRSVDTAGASNVAVVQADLLQGVPFAGSFDCVVVDAPCSGTGILRRDPDIRWRREERDLEALAAAQRRMLRHAASAVAPGGRLIYATCSSEPEENEAVVAMFLADHGEFSPVDARSVHPGLAPAVVDERGHLRTTPDRHQLEGFFGAVFTRRA